MDIMKFYDYNKLFSSLSAITSGWTKMILTIKAAKTDVDIAAKLQVVVTKAALSTDGVLKLNGAAATEAQRVLGSLSVDQPNARITFSLKDDLTALMSNPTTGSWYYDIKEINSTGSILVKTGLVTIENPVTRTYS
jgi:hypothetical protein